MVVFVSSFPGDFSSTNGFMCVFQKRQFSVADADNQLPLFIAVFSCQGDAAFTVDQAGNIGGIGSGEWMYLGWFWHSASLQIWPLTGLLRSRACCVGGGGGTAVPEFSFRAGLLLHLPLPAGEGVL